MRYHLFYHDAAYSTEEFIETFEAENQEDADRIAEHKSKYCDEGCHYYATPVVTLKDKYTWDELHEAVSKCARATMDELVDDKEDLMDFLSEWFGNDVPEIGEVNYILDEMSGFVIGQVSGR